MNRTTRSIFLVTAKAKKSKMRLKSGAWDLYDWWIKRTGIIHKRGLYP